MGQMKSYGLKLFQLFNWALEPADDEILDQLFEVGYLDAAVWASENHVKKILQDNNVLAA